jgi:hypothetical protein
MQLSAAGRIKKLKQKAALPEEDGKKLKKASICR